MAELRIDSEYTCRHVSPKLSVIAGIQGGMESTIALSIVCRGIIVSCAFRLASMNFCWVIVSGPNYSHQSDIYCFSCGEHMTVWG